LLDCCCCSLFFWTFNRLNPSDSSLLCQYPLFSPTGKISSHPGDIVVSLAELDGSRIRFVATGQNRFEAFVYFTLIGADFSLSHHSFGSNNADFRWNPSTCLLHRPPCVVANCVSTIKIMTLIDDQFRLFQFDVEAFLARLMKQSIQTLESFETDVIEKCEAKASVIVSIGYIFYSQKRERWDIGVSLVELPVDGRVTRQLHDEFVGYELRPQGQQLREDLKRRMRQFANLHLDERAKDSFVTSESHGGDVRLIAAPQFNLIIAVDSQKTQRR
jgi:hypothetical protein